MALSNSLYVLMAPSVKEHGHPRITKFVHNETCAFVDTL